LREISEKNEKCEKGVERGVDVKIPIVIPKDVNNSILIGLMKYYLISGNSTLIIWTTRHFCL
jgi:hypothetical protein